MLVWTEEQWRKRFMEQYNRIMQRMVIFLVLLYLVIVMIFVTMGLLMATRETFLVFVIIIVFITLTFGLITPISLFLSKREIAKAPATGLYKYGLQLTPFYFIPYFEMARTERQWRGWPKKAEAIVIHPRYDRRSWFDRASFPWAVKMSFLDEEGARELEDIVSGDDGLKTPPKLVVYE